jgi:CubicO group peptidase (beta-lactamase class C family)
MTAEARFSKPRLERMRSVLEAYVERGEVAGVVTLLERRGATHISSFGYRDLERREPIADDTLFRIASMTKPITAVAAMILVEECRLRLDEPLDGLLPELANRRVLKRIDGALDDTEPARRPLTLRDLLTFRLGYGLILGPADRYPVQQEATRLDLGGLKPRTPHGPDEWLRRFATLPLLYQPGDRWLYHTGSDILGVLISRVAGQPFETFLREQIFEPLGMLDTCFTVPPEKLDRLSSCYELNPRTSALDLYDDARASQWSKPPPFPSGGGGLVSTIQDYRAFGRMMLDKGRHGAGRILSRTTVEAMTTDQMTPQQKAVSPFFPGFWDHTGWGLGLSVITQRDSGSASPGQFGWAGAYGTRWICDPREDLVAILMIQRLEMGPTAINSDFLTLAYQSWDD